MMMCLLAVPAGLGKRCTHVSDLNPGLAVRIVVGKFKPQKVFPRFRSMLDVDVKMKNA
jgi:hypothetical protein